MAQENSTANVEAENPAVQLSFDRFDTEIALKLGLTLVESAQARKLVVAIGIDMGEQIVFRAAMPGTNADYQTWLERKFNSVRRFSKSSYALEVGLKSNPDFASERALDAARFALVGGAVPILIDTTLVGVVGVAGLQSHEDHALVVDALLRVGAKPLVQ
ncbi:heme-binding protein [Paraburkholderia bannensis]|uniref:heme-binding protein n=1 Tax=Paraburkholderia bannensis TaxID=765414 RepID=UPI002AC35685|nr:heme-binding protein [Paraburkholderia bannensis]